MKLLRHLLSIMLLPGMVTVVVPAYILHSTSGSPAGTLLFPRAALPLTAGVLFVLAGLWLMVKTISLFVRVGQGTLAPWDPTTHLVVQGIYRNVRNPMISGVFSILLGETLFFWSRPMGVWLTIFVAANNIYIPLLEERGLEKKFGREYLDYKANVPRWIPRLKPWEQPTPKTSRN